MGSLPCDCFQAVAPGGGAQEDPASLPGLTRAKSLAGPGRLEFLGQNTRDRSLHRPPGDLQGVPLE